MSRSGLMGAPGQTMGGVKSSRTPPPSPLPLEGIACSAANYMYMYMYVHEIT